MSNVIITRQGSGPRAKPHTVAYGKPGFRKSGLQPAVTLTVRSTSKQYPIYEVLIQKEDLEKALEFLSDES